MSDPGSHRLSAAALELLTRRAGIKPDATPRPTDTESAPLATAQLGQWLLDQTRGPAAPGAMPKILHLEGPLDRTALRRALTEIVRRHRILRTEISLRDGEPIQRATAPREVEIREVDLRGTAAPERPEVARALLDQDARFPFKQSGDLLLRPMLVQLADQVFELLVTFHQVAFDGWSNGVFLHELGELYSAFARGRESPLAELPIQFADFAIWEQAHHGSPVSDADRGYWLGRLKGSTTALDLVSDRPRPRPRTYVRATAVATIDAALTVRLSRIALEEGTTLFALTFAAFQVLMGRRAGQDDFVLGVASANRTHRQTEGLIGSFATVIPVRARLGEPASFRSHLRRTGESLSEGLAHQSYPFQGLMATLRPGGQPGSDPLFDVVFNYRNLPVALPAMDGLSVSNFRAPHLSSTYDLHLNLTPAAGCIELELEYDPAVFHGGTAARWLAGYVAALEAVAADPQVTTTGMPVMPADEHRLLTEQWSGAAVASPASDPVIDRFVRAAAAYPDTPAVEQDGLVVTYRDLERRVRGLTGRLRRLGVAPGELVGLCGDRSIEVVAALLAILSLRAVYVPLDPRIPPRRTDTMLDSAGLRMILTDRVAAPALANRPEPQHRLADLCAPADAADPEGEPAPGGTMDPAYIIFTSGSTGDPKGVVIPHQGLARYAMSSAERYAMRPGDRMLHCAALTFDLSIEEIFAPLCLGATVVVGPEAMKESPEIFAEQCRSLRLTHLSLPTAFWSEVVSADWPLGLDLGAVRVIAVIGEAMAPDSVQRFFAVAKPGTRLFNCYGPTEATVAATSAELKPGDEYPGEVPIGRPYPGVTVWVLDPQRRPVPIGTPGELWIGGGNLALRYLGAPELTEERFPSNLSVTMPGERRYRTGDRVRWRDDGQLGFLGRTDLQMKTRGYRIEPADVERGLRKAPGVSQAAVILHPADDRLVAFVVSDRESPLDLRAVRESAEGELPHYMVPGEVIQIQRLPLGSTGKLDRRALAALVPTARSPGVAAQRTPTEQIVTRIWQEVLRVTGIGVHDHFLELGGHSLHAMRVANRLRAELGISLSLRTLLEHQTVATLARELDRPASGG